MYDVEPDFELLRIVGDLADARKSGTDTIAQVKYDADVAAKRPARMTKAAPWFGLDREFGVLRDAGYITVDVGMADLVPPGVPTPGPGPYFIDLTDSGREALRQN